MLELLETFLVKELFSDVAKTRRDLVFQLRRLIEVHKDFVLNVAEYFAHIPRDMSINESLNLWP